MYFQYGSCFEKPQKNHPSDTHFWKNIRLPSMPNVGHFHYKVNAIFSAQGSELIYLCALLSLEERLYSLNF